MEEGRLATALGGALAGMSNESYKSLLRSAAEESVNGLFQIYIHCHNDKLQKSIRQTIDLLCDEFGPERADSEPRNESETDAQ